LAISVPGPAHPAPGPVLFCATAQDAAELIARIEGPQPEIPQTKDAPEGEEGVEDEEPNLDAMTLPELMAHFQVPGVSIAVIRDFDVHWAKGYGIADVDTGAAVDTETMFQAASISKPVAAMGVLKAVQDGLFGLDDDINSILTTWQLDGDGMTDELAVTPRMLTSHTSGLGDAFGFPGYDPEDPLPTLVQIFEGDDLSNVGKLFMERPPYQAYEYSGGGVTLMQQALVDARGRPFADILQDDVLTPIGMTRSSFAQPISPEHDQNAARAHNGTGEAMGAKWHVYPEQAAAGLWTTPTDLARFAIEVQKSAVGQSNRVLSRSMVQEMLTPVGVGNFAVGFGLNKEGEGWYFQHNGGNWGFRCTLVAHKLKGYGLAVMTNGDRGSPLMNVLSERIKRAYQWDAYAEPVPRGYAPPVERTAIAVDQAILETYVGNYMIDDTPHAILLEDGALYVQPDGQEKYLMLAESETRFFLEVSSGVLLTFTHDEDGAVDGVMVHSSGKDSPGKRVSKEP
jgi:CubicO group peptidase (beta-lactamase class C family)